MAVRNGMDGFSLQRLYGWEEIGTAMHYVTLAGTALREAHAKASPVDRLLDG
jgi:site-specific recombinase XerD